MGTRGVPPITPPREKVDELVRRYNAGERLADLADWLGVGRTTIQRILDDEGVPRRQPPRVGHGNRPRQVPREDYEKIAREYATSTTPASRIADRYGVSRQRIRAIIDEVDPDAARKHHALTEGVDRARKQTVSS